MISVIIPTYNRSSTIKRAILSVLNQTYKDLELLIIDDCSEDNTYDIVKSINDKRVRYYKLAKNSGACYARNYGISLAKGEYIAFQDSDDEWLPDKLEQQLKAMNEAKASVIFNKIKLSDDHGKYIKTIPRIKTSRLVTHSELLNKSIVGTPSLMFKKECLGNTSFDINLPRLQDWDFVLNLSKNNDIYFLNEVLVNSYVQTNSISKNSIKGIKALDIIFEKYKEELKASKAAYANYLMLKADYQEKKECLNTLKKALKVKFSVYQLLKALKIYFSK